MPGLIGTTTATLLIRPCSCGHACRAHRPEPLGKLLQQPGAVDAADPERPAREEVEHERRPAAEPFRAEAPDVQRLDLRVGHLPAPGRALEPQPALLQLQLPGLDRAAGGAPENGIALHALMLVAAPHSGIGGPS